MKQTSRVIATWRLLHTLLQTAATGAGYGPKFVVLGGTFDPASEGILLPGVPSNSPDFTRPTNNSKEETFILRCVPYSQVEGQDADSVLDRLETFADLIQNSIRDINTGKPATYFQTGLGSPFAYGEVVQWAPRLSGAPRGIAGDGDLDIQFLIRI